MYLFKQENVPRTSGKKRGGANGKLCVGRGKVGGVGGMIGALGGTFTMKEEERGRREHKITNTTSNPNISIYLYLYTRLHYTK